MDWNRLFPKIYIINLEYRKDRKKHMKKLLKDLNITNYEFINATDRDEKNWINALIEIGVIKNKNEYKPELLFTNKYKKNLESKDEDTKKSYQGKIAVTLSHLRIYNKISKSKNNKLNLIFEDDIFLEPNFNKESFSDLYKKAIINKVDVLYLGDCIKHRSRDKKIIFKGEKNDLIKVSFVTCTHAYAINSRTSKIYLKNILPMIRDIDDRISDINTNEKNKINYLIFNKNIFKQIEDAKSDIDKYKFNKKNITN